MTGPSADHVEAWVRRTCAEQGLAVKVTDALVLAQVVTLLGQRREAAHAAEPRAEPLPCASEAPGGLDAVRIQALSALHAGADGGVVQYGANDSRSPAERKSGPLIAQRSAAL